ncbi:hypothetical protein B6U71_03800 [Euryarchaeota archaeon ex4484_178]|nr:MAG: hypothetical protein B6U71_03800 [Euryarchaeota archaeon ex4484_178]
MPLDIILRKRTLYEKHRYAFLALQFQQLGEQPPLPPLGFRFAVLVDVPRKGEEKGRSGFEPE